MFPGVAAASAAVDVASTWALQYQQWGVVGDISVWLAAAHCRWLA